MQMNEFEQQARQADGQPRGFHFLSAGDLCTQPSPTQWCIKGYLEAGTLACLFGEPGSMKSFLAIDMGLCTATGIDWHDIKVRLQGPVFYIAGEGHEGIKRRTTAWGIHHGIDLKTVPFFVSDRPARFLDADNAAEVAQAVEDLVLLHGQPAVIVVDTLNRNFGPGDENKTEDMTRFVSVIDETLRCRYRCLVLIVHHSGLAEKDRARGASALRASLDWEYRLQKNADGTRILTCTKSKDHEEPAVLAFTPEVVTLGNWIDEDGEAMTSCVLIRTEGVSDTKPLTGVRKIAYEALVKFGGCVHIDVWREAAYSSGITTSSEATAKRQAFHRAVTALRSGGYVEAKDDLWWPTI